MQQAEKTRSFKHRLVLRGSLPGGMRRFPPRLPHGPVPEHGAPSTDTSLQRLSPPGSLERLDPLLTLLLAVTLEAVFPLRLLNETCRG